MSVTVLSAGREPALLKTRNEILARSGCIVTSANSNADLVNMFFDGDYDLVVLCHTIPTEERKKILRMVKNYRPSMLALVVADRRESDVMEGGQLFGQRVPPGPEELVKAIRSSFPQLSLVA